MFEDIKPHIKDLRKRLTISVIAFIIAFFVCFVVYEPILKWMMFPVEAVLPSNTQMVAIEIQETFFTALKVSFFGAFILSMPIVLWQMWMFFSPALYANEKKFIIPFVMFGMIMFTIGGSFAYYIVIPIGFDFLVNFGTTIVTVMPSIGKYVGFFTKLMIGFGIAFELPVITFFLASVGMVTDQTLKSFFKYAIIIIFLVSALLTPPDVITQFLMAVPLIVLYGISIYIAKVVNPHKNNDDEDTEEKAK